jgi:hypothetical protein
MLQRQPIVISHPLIARKTIWCPTLLGWGCLLALFSAIALLWALQGERFLSKTDRIPAEVLVVEGWIGIDGIHAASAEFNQGGYKYIVATSGLTNNRWDRERYSYASLAGEQLLQRGIARDRILIAMPLETEGHRTFQSAAAVWRTLRARNIHPASINVFTFGTHSRRSQLVFAKVFAPETKVGVISWVPTGYTSEPWWHSSERAGELLRETTGFLFEAILNSGRRSNAPSIAVPLSSFSSIRLDAQAAGK